MLRELYLDWGVVSTWIHYRKKKKEKALTIPQYKRAASAFVLNSGFILF